MLIYDIITDIIVPLSPYYLDAKLVFENMENNKKKKKMMMARPEPWRARCDEEEHKIKKKK